MTYFQVLNVVVAVLGTLSSLCPIMAILGSATLRLVVMFQMLANLAISESFFLLVVIVNAVTNLVGVTRSPFICSATMSMVIAAAISASFALFTLSLERYISVIHGLRYHDLLNDTRRRLLVASSWLAGAVYWMLNTLQMMEFNDWTNYQGECNLLLVVPPYLLSLSFATVLLTSVVVLVMNLTVSQQAARHSREINEQRRMMGLSEDENPMRSFWGILKACLIVLLLIIPANVISLVDLWITPVDPVFKQVSLIMMIITYCCDGWIFGFYNSQLQARYRQMFFGEAPARPVDIGMGFDGALAEYSEQEFVAGIECERNEGVPEVVVEAPSDSVHSVEADGEACQQDSPDQPADESAEDHQERCSLQDALPEQSQSSADNSTPTEEEQPAAEGGDKHQNSFENSSQSIWSVESTAGGTQENQVQSIAELDVVYRRTDDGKCVPFKIRPDLLTGYVKTAVESQKENGFKFVTPVISHEPVNDADKDNKQETQNAFNLMPEESCPNVYTRDTADNDPLEDMIKEIERTSEDSSIDEDTVDNTSYGHNCEKNVSITADDARKKAEIGLKTTGGITSDTTFEHLSQEQVDNIGERNSVPSDIVENFILPKNEANEEPQGSCKTSAEKPTNGNRTVAYHSQYHHGGVQYAAADTEYRLPCSYDSTDMPPVE